MSERPFDLQTDSIFQPFPKWQGWAIVVLATPALMLGASVAAVVGILAITVVAGPLYAVSQRAAEDLVRPDAYVSAVLEAR